MKRKLIYFAGVFIFFLLSVNIFLFAKTVALADSIIQIEAKTAKLKLENVELEKKVSSLSSLYHLEKLAPQLGFTKKSEPVFLPSLNVALNQ